MPGWHKRTKKLQESGKIQIIGIIQEQHAERCRLFKQWQGFDWPILVDSLNLYGLPSIPIAMAVDEHGILRMSHVRPGEKFDQFLKTDYPTPAQEVAAKDYRNLEELRTKVTKEPTCQNYLSLGSGEFLFGGSQGPTKAIDAFSSALAAQPTNAVAAFRLGVAYRRRFDDDPRFVGDFQKASTAWSEALALNPGQYIWRRRIQQFGPRLQKPYNFYRWIAMARHDLRKRGMKPIKLRVPLTASEKMQKDDSPVSLGLVNPDAKKQVPNDDKKLARLARALVPARVKKGKTARLHILLLPNKKLKAHWDPDAGPVKLWLNEDAAWQRSGSLSQSKDLLSTTAARSIEVEIVVPKDATNGPHQLTGFALYPICEDADGTCQFLRQDFTIELEVK